MAQSLMAGDVEAIFGTVIDKAKAGDMLAARLIAERVCPPPKSKTYVQIDLPPLSTPADLVAATAVIVAEVGAGKLALEDVGPLVALVEAATEAIKTNDLEVRLTALERFAEDRRLLRAVG
jgi:hypothetical protein